MKKGNDYQLSIPQLHGDLGVTTTSIAIVIVKPNTEVRAKNNSVNDVNPITSFY